MILLGLDLATKVGYAIGDIMVGPTWGHTKLPTTGADVGKFLHHYRAWLMGLISVERPDWVAFEAPVLPDKTSLMTVRKLQGLCSITELACRDVGIDCSEANNQKVKVFMTGSGGKKGDKMIRACHARNWRTDDDDEADACGVWLYTLAELDKIHGTRHANAFEPLFVEGKHYGRC